MRVRSLLVKIPVSLSGAPIVYHRPLIPIAVALAAGIFAGGAWPGYWPQTAFIGAWALVWLTFAFCRGQQTAWSPLILLGALGYGLIAPWLPLKLPENHISRYTDSHRWHIEGVVQQRLPARYERARLIMQVTRLTGQPGAFGVNGLIRVTISEDLPGIDPGSRLAFSSRIRSFRNFNNPGGFNYRRHMLFQRIWGSAFADANRLELLETTEPQALSFLASYRSQASTLIEQLPDPTTQAVLQALLIGKREAVSPDVRRMFNRCGVGHLLAISGLHIGIVGGLVFGFFHWWLNRFHPILDRGWGRRGATLLATGPVVAYAVLAGLSPSTQRALIMVLAYMATYFVYRDGDTLNFLALAALLMLIWNPPALFSVSFQMSFAAVFWIVLGLSTGAGDSKVRLAGLRTWLFRFRTFLLVTVWAIAGTLPLVMAYFQEISMIGLPANCFMVPVIGFFVLPVGLTSLAVLPFCEALAGWGIQLAGWGLARTLDAMQWLAALDGVALATFIPTPLEIILYYGVLGLICARNTIRSARWLLLLPMIFVLADAIYWSYERFWHDDLRVTVLDVGQGSGALVEFPGGATMLIDGGGYSDNRYFDVGERIIAPFLRYRKILQVDTVVLSHPSSDHMNGLVYIMAHFEPQRLLWTGDRVPTASFRSFFREVVGRGVDSPPFDETERKMTIGDVDVTVFCPAAFDLGASQQLSAKDRNNRSLVVKLKMGSNGILFPGDIETYAEGRLVDCCRSSIVSQVLVAPHHGSRTSSSIDFLRAVDPKMVIVSAGWQNRFGFPHKSVLERYRELGSRIYRTDHHGAIMLRTDGRQWRMTTQRN